MKKTYSGKLVEWTFALGSVGLAWQLDLSTFLKSFSHSLGIVNGSRIDTIIVTQGVPIILATISLVAVTAAQFFEKILWRWCPWFGCKRGWWVYGLVSQHEKTKNEHVGIFYLSHDIKDTKILNGCVWSVKNDSLERRGDWYSDTVCLSEDKLAFIYSIDIVRRQFDFDYSMQYEGHLVMNHKTRNKPFVGKEAWEGKFQDFGDRREAFGWVYAERLSHRIMGYEKAKAIMDKYAKEIIGKAVERAG